MILALVLVGSALCLAGGLAIEIWLAIYFFQMLYQGPSAGAGWDT